MPDETIDATTYQETAPTAEADPPPADMMSEVRHYYALLQVDYTRRIGEIEAFLGFAESSEALGARLAKVEAFLGIKG